MTVTSKLHAHISLLFLLTEKRREGCIHWGHRQRPRTGRRCSGTGAGCRARPRARAADDLSAEGTACANLNKPTQVATPDQGRPACARSSHPSAGSKPQIQHRPLRERKGRRSRRSPAGRRDASLEPRSPPDIYKPLPVPAEAAERAQGQKEQRNRKEKRRRYPVRARAETQDRKNGAQARGRAAARGGRVGFIENTETRHKQSGGR